MMQVWDVHCKKKKNWLCENSIIVHFTARGKYSTSYSTETHPQEGGRSASHVCFGNPTVYGTQDKFEQVAVSADLADVSLLSGQLGILGVCTEKHPLK